MVQIMEAYCPVLLTDRTNAQTAPNNLSDVSISCFIFSAVHGFGLKWIYWNVGGDRLKKESVPVSPTEFTACNKLHPRNFLFFSIFRTMMMFLQVWHQSFWELQIQIHSFWELWPVNHIWCGRSRCKNCVNFYPNEHYVYHTNLFALPGALDVMIIRQVVTTLRQQSKHYALQQFGAVWDQIMFWCAITNLGWWDGCRQTFMLQPSWFSFSSLGLDNKEFIGKLFRPWSWSIHFNWLAQSAREKQTYEWTKSKNIQKCYKVFQWPHSTLLICSSEG